MNDRVKVTIELSKRDYKFLEDLKKLVPGRDLTVTDIIEMKIEDYVERNIKNRKNERH